jgi:hypothetical protein
MLKIVLTQIKQSSKKPPKCETAIAPAVKVGNIGSAKNSFLGFSNEIKIAAYRICEGVFH